MSLDLVIGHKGEDHVTSADFARLLKLIIGPTKNYENANDCLILRNPELSALIADNTITLSIVGGYYSICGRFAYSLNTTTLTVPGVVTSGNKRKDAIIVEFNRVNNIESVEYKVIQGNETSSTPALPTLPHDTGNPEVNATFQMLIGVLNIEGSSVSCESLETYGDYGNPQVNRVRSLHDSFRNYIMLLPEASVKGSCVGFAGSEQVISNYTLFSLLKDVGSLHPATTIVGDDGRITVFSADLMFVDYLGDVYRVSKQNTFQVNLNSYYMAELDVTLDLNKYFAHHEQTRSSANFPFSASMVLLKAQNGGLSNHICDGEKRTINTRPGSSYDTLTLGEVKRSASNRGRVITFKIPLIYFYIGSSRYDVFTIYDISNPDYFCEKFVKNTVRYFDSTDFENIPVYGDIISIIDKETQLPVEYTKSYKMSDESCRVTITNPVSGHHMRVTYYLESNDGSITEIVQPSA